MQIYLDSTHSGGSFVNKNEKNNKQNGRMSPRTVGLGLPPTAPSPALAFTVPPINIAAAIHGTKSNPVLLWRRTWQWRRAKGEREQDRLDRIAWMLIQDEGDVVIKDSISQRSAWCDHILPQTDGVPLTSALRKARLSQTVTSSPPVSQNMQSSKGWGLESVSRS